MNDPENVGRALGDLLAPELRGIAAKLDSIHKRLDAMDGDINSVRNEVSAMEARMAAAIENAKREIALVIRIAAAEQRHAMLLRKISELEHKSHR